MLATLVLSALLSILLACGAMARGDAASSNDVAAYLGTWQRVTGGEPDAQRSLVVERQDGDTRVTFGDLTTGLSAGGVVTVRAGRLSLDPPTGNGILDAPGLQLSLGADGRLVVDEVPDDGTTEPVWVYERSVTPGATAGP
jgi:hypothetical protein